MSNKKKRNISGTEVKIRKAGISDMADLYKWRNHPETRTNSFNPNSISWDEHEKWFIRRIEDTNTTIYIACSENQKIGSIRFEDKGEAIKVSVMLNPDCSGKGFGSKIIRLGTEKFIKERQPDKPMHAEIKKDNIASLKAFQKAGFEESYSVFVYSK